MGAVETVRPRVSFADLERAPEDGLRYELYDGEVYVVPAPIPLHQVIQYALAEELRAICRRHGGFAVGSPIDIVFSDYDVVQPDLIVFGPARAHLVDLRTVIRHAPDLCVEILKAVRPPTFASLTAPQGGAMTALGRPGGGHHVG